MPDRVRHDRPNYVLFPCVPVRFVELQNKIIDQPLNFIGLFTNDGDFSCSRLDSTASNLEL